MNWALHLELSLTDCGFATEVTAPEASSFTSSRANSELAPREPKLSRPITQGLDCRSTHPPQGKFPVPFPCAGLTLLICVEPQLSRTEPLCQASSQLLGPDVHRLLWAESTVLNALSHPVLGPPINTLAWAHIAKFGPTDGYTSMKTCSSLFILSRAHTSVTHLLNPSLLLSGAPPPTYTHRHNFPGCI